MQLGFQYVKEKINRLSTEPGCYIMKDHDGRIFYIGKAKNVKARLKSYFSGTDTRLFVQFLETILSDIEIILVRNDTEALVLERELIKKYKPRFNIMLKDDKNYILLKLKKALPKKKKDQYPRLEIVRKVKKDHAHYFGPYPSAGRLRTMVELINKYFLLRTCNDQIIENRVRPCVQYQIGRCLAPCVYEINNYQQEVNNVLSLLSGNYGELKKRLTEKMWQLSQQEQFEAAAKIRDQLQAIEASLESQVILQVNLNKSQDIIGIKRAGPDIEIVQMHIRNGVWQQNRNIALSEQYFPTQEIIRSFLQQAYKEASIGEIPQQIIIPSDITDELSGLTKELAKTSEHKVEFIYPKKGKIKKLLDIANKNAELALQERLKQRDSQERALKSIQNILSLDILPKRIECIDISLIQGSDPFGSVVTFIDGIPQKNLYRIYKIKNIEGMNDFAMIKEVVYRRIKRGLKEGVLPDLLLIDGGKGQLSSAIDAIDECDLIISHQGFYVAGIAKARTTKPKDSDNEKIISRSCERLFVPNKKDPILLQPHTFERYLVEQIRDEAHRFALEAHRRGRKKRTLQSKLLSIPGVGKKIATKLLKTFGSTNNIKTKSEDEIAEQAKLPKQLAKKILSTLNANEG